MFARSACIAEIALALSVVVGCFLAGIGAPCCVSPMLSSCGDEGLAWTWFAFVVARADLAERFGGIAEIS